MLNKELVDKNTISVHYKIFRMQTKIKEFMEYDKKRNKYVNSLEEEIKTLQGLLDEANDDLSTLSMGDDVISSLRNKVKNQRLEINRLSKRPIPEEVTTDEMVQSLQQANTRLQKDINKFKKLYQTTLSEISGLISKQLHGNNADVVAIIKNLIDNSNKYLNLC